MFQEKWPAQLLLGKGTGWSRRRDGKGSLGIHLTVEPGEQEALAGPGAPWSLGRASRWKQRWEGQGYHPQEGRPGWGPGAGSAHGNWGWLPAPREDPSCR